VYKYTINIKGLNDSNFASSGKHRDRSRDFRTWDIAVTFSCSVLTSSAYFIRKNFDIRRLYVQEHNHDVLIISVQGSQCYLGVTNSYFSMSMVVSTRLIKTTAVQALQAQIPHELWRCWIWDSNKVAASSQRIVMHLNLRGSAPLYVGFIATTNTPKTCVRCAPKHICSDVNGGKFSSVATPHILLVTLLSEHPWSTFFPWVTDLISHPYRTT